MRISLRTLAHTHHHGVERLALRISSLLLSLLVSPHGRRISESVGHHHVGDFLRILSLHDERLSELHLLGELLLHNHTRHATHRETAHWHHYHISHARLHSHALGEHHILHDHLLLLLSDSLGSTRLGCELHLRILDHTAL